MSDLKIFHGLSEIAGQGYNTVCGLRENGFYARLVVWRNSQSGYPNDYSFDMEKRYMWRAPKWLIAILKMERKILRKYDVFHFHFGRTLLFNYDLWILRKFHKKVFFEFHGSDLRDYRSAKQINPYLEYDEIINNKNFKRRTAKIVKYASGIIVHDDELIPYLPHEYKKVFVVPLRVNLSLFSPVYKRDCQDTIRIVHAPTNRIGKGSADIIKIIEALRKEYFIDFVLVENKTQLEAKEIYAGADIIIDQICIGTYGVFAIEGMALGKPVITYITEEMRTSFPDELPIISANKDNLRKVLIPLLTSNKLREDIGRRGRVYVETYHDYYKVTNYLGEIYQGNVEPLRGKEAFAFLKKYSS